MEEQDEMGKRGLGRRVVVIGRRRAAGRGKNHPAFF